MPLYASKDAFGVYTHACAEWASMLGLDNPSEVIGKTDAELLPPTNASELRRNDDIARTNNGQFTTQTIRTKNGWRVINSWIDLKAEGVVTIKANDITEAVDPLGILGLLDFKQKKLNTKDIFGADLNHIGMACMIGTCKGWPPARIAESVHRSKKTVEYHLRKIRIRVEEITPGSTIQECVFHTGFYVLLLRNNWFED